MRERKLDKRENELAVQQQNLQQIYQRQLKLNQLLEHSEKERDKVKFENTVLKNEISKKQTENDAFHDLAEVAGFIIDNASKLYQNENRYYSAMNDLEDAMAKSMGEENYHKWKLRGGNYGR